MRFDHMKTVARCRTRVKSSFPSFSLAVLILILVTIVAPEIAAAFSQNNAGISTRSTAGTTSTLIQRRQQQQQQQHHKHQFSLHNRQSTISSNVSKSSRSSSSSSSSALNLSPTNFISRNILNRNKNNSNSYGNGDKHGKDHGHGRRSSGVEISSTMTHSDIAVRLDQPILSPSSTQFRDNASTMLKSILTILLSDVAKTACVAFILAFIITFLSKSSTKTISKISPIMNTIKHILKLLQGQISKLKDGIMKSNSKENGVPVTFDKDNDGNMSWGVCTLSAKKKLGRSNYMKYDFKLPKAENILNLALGQKVSLCCLDNDNKVAKKDYYLFTPKNGKGRFSILSSIDGSEEDDNLKLTSGEGDFSKVLSEELDIGDEIALQPGPRTLSYRGEYLPVTDMLYIASGSGIAPVLDQVKAVLPSGSSSVKSVSVIWRNDNEEDFDVALSSLEDEYFKYSTKLAVSCVVDEEKGRRLDQNSEIEEALPSFEPGTMAVVAGPRQFSSEARAMLVGYGYPEECICVLP